MYNMFLALQAVFEMILTWTSWSLTKIPYLDLVIPLIYYLVLGTLPYSEVVPNPVTVAKEPTGGAEMGEGKHRGRI